MGAIICSVMAQSIPRVPIPAGYLSVLLETVIILPLSIFHFKVCLFSIVIDIFIKNIFTCHTYALKRYV